METSPIEKLTQLFGLALANGLCKNKSDFAEFIGMDNSSISHAFANNGKIKVENVVRRAEEALNKAGVSLTIVGDGSMQNVSGSNNSIGVPEKKFNRKDGHRFTFRGNGSTARNVRTAHKPLTHYHRKNAVVICL